MASTTWPASSWARRSARELLTGKSIRAGDVLLGLPSNGLHTNGYSLARKLLFEVAGYGPKTLLPEVGATVGDALLAVHRSYLKPIRALMAAGLLHGAAHITGGGITDNTPRMLPKGLAATIETGSWRIPADFRSAAADRQHSGGRLPAHVQSGRRHDPGRAGARGGEGRGGAAQDGRDAVPHRQRGGAEARASARGVPVKRLGILISGRGSNFEAIADNVASGADSTPRSPW